MTLGLATDGLLALLILGLGIWTIAARETYGAIVGYVAYGLLVAVVWVRLAALDVALTEAALGSGLVGLLMLGAAAHLPREASGKPPPCWMRMLAVVLSATVAVGLGAVVLLLPQPAPNLVPAALENLHATGLANPVTGVLIAYRAIDTLLEKVVLVLVLIGLWSLATDRGWGGRPGALRLAHPGSALVLLASLLPPIGIVVGIHLLWVGADAPGGAFQGAAVLAAMWVLAMLAGLARAPTTASRALRWVAAVGPLSFLGLGVAGFFIADGFLSYPEAAAKPLIIAVEAAITLSIAAILGLLLAGPPLPERPDSERSHERAPDRSPDRSTETPS